MLSTFNIVAEPTRNECPGDIVTLETYLATWPKAVYDQCPGDIVTLETGGAGSEPVAALKCPGDIVTLETRPSTSEAIGQSRVRGTQLPSKLGELSRRLWRLLDDIEKYEETNGQREIEKGDK